MSHQQSHFLLTAECRAIFLEREGKQIYEKLERERERTVAKLTGRWAVFVLLISFKTGRKKKNTDLSSFIVYVFFSLKGSGKKKEVFDFLILTALCSLQVLKNLPA